MAILRPDGDVTCSLSCSSGSSHYALIDESTLDTADYVSLISNPASTAPVTGSDLVSVETFTPNAAVKKIVGSFYIALSPGDYGGTASCTIKIYTGTTELASASATNGWNYVTYTGSLTQDEIDALRAYVYFSVVSGSYWFEKSQTWFYYQSTGYCYMAYIYPDTSLLPSGIASSAAYGSPKLTIYLLPGSIASGAIFGSTDVSQGKILAPNSITGSAACGSPQLDFTITLFAITSTSEVGEPWLDLHITAAGIISTTVYGTAGILQIGRLAPSGIAPTVSFGTPELEYDQTITPTPIDPALAFGTPRLGINIIPPGIASAMVLGAPILMQEQFLTPSAIASSTAVGEPWLDLHITAAGIAPTIAFGTAALIPDQAITPTSITITAVFGTPLVSQDHITATGIASLLSFGSPSVNNFFHVILAAVYAVEAPDVNRTYVVGSDATGAQVSGSAITQADVDLVGERMDAHHNPAIPTAAIAAAVATAQLAKARLDGKRALITVAPHCGVELWDVVNITDDIANQASSYRVSGYIFEFRSGVYCHTLELCAL